MLIYVTRLLLMFFKKLHLIYSALNPIKVLLLVVVNDQNLLQEKDLD